MLSMVDDYLPNLYGIGFTFSLSIWCNNGVKMRHASLSSSLEKETVMANGVRSTDFITLSNK